MTIGALRDRAPKHGSCKPFLAGAAIVLVGSALCAALGLGLHAGFRNLPVPFSILAEALVLKLMFSARSLVNAGEAVRRALELGDLEAARRLVGWHLVSRIPRDSINPRSPRPRSNRWPKTRATPSSPRCCSMRSPACPARWLIVSSILATRCSAITIGSASGWENAPPVSTTWSTSFPRG